MASRFLDLVNERVVVYDGATGTFLQQLDPVSYTHLTLPTIYSV